MLEINILTHNKNGCFNKSAALGLLSYSFYKHFFMKSVASLVRYFGISTYPLTIFYLVISILSS